MVVLEINLISKKLVERVTEIRIIFLNDCADQIQEKNHVVFDLVRDIYSCKCCNDVVSFFIFALFDGVALQ